MHFLSKKVLPLILTVFLLLGLNLSINSYVFTSNALDDYTTWSQLDSRWSSKTLGDGSATIGKYGCIATSLAMLVVHSGSNYASSSFNPGTLVDSMNKLDAFDSYGSLINWNAISQVAPDVSCVSRFSVTATNQSQYISQVKELNDQGYYLICEVGGHWVLLDRIEGDTLYMLDPGSTSTDLLSKYPFNPSTHEVIRCFKGNKTPAKSNAYDSTNTTDSSQTTFITGRYSITASSLNIRAGVGTAYNVLGGIPNNAEVNVTEISGNWGKVTYNGISGWICLDYAKYISVVPEQTTTPATTSTTTTTTSTTTTTTTSTTTSTTTTTTSTTSSTTSTTTTTTSTTSTTTTATTTSDTTAPATSTTNEYILINDLEIHYNNNSLLLQKGYVINVFDFVGEFAKVNLNNSVVLIEKSNLMLVDVVDSPIIKGDINNDGVINKLDFTIINEFLMITENISGASVFTNREFLSADVNEDGIIDYDDAFNILILICN